MQASSIFMKDISQLYCTVCSLSQVVRNSIIFSEALHGTLDIFSGNMASMARVPYCPIQAFVFVFQ